MRGHGSLNLIRVYPNLMEPLVQVEICEVKRISNPIKHLINPPKVVLVYHSQPVERLDGWTVVHTMRSFPLALGTK